MRELLTPRLVAKAIMVSESSIKRWCDKGVIPTQYTVGGHRRILLSGLLKFLRASQYTLVRPELLGLPTAIGQSVRAIDSAAAQFAAALIAGDEDQCRRITLDLYLAEHTIASICDQVLASSFAVIGDQWERGDAQIYQERRGCEIAARLLHELRALVPAPPADAVLAIGGTIEGDPFTLATTMVELVLRDAKWNAISLGNHLPFATLAAAIREQRPRLFWLSCSSIPNEDDFLNGFSSLYDEFGRDVALVVGGRGLTGELRRKMKYSAYCDNIRHLEACARTLHGG